MCEETEQRQFVSTTQRSHTGAHPLGLGENLYCFADHEVFFQSIFIFMRIHNFQAQVLTVLTLQ